MNYYFDSSVILRILLDQADKFTMPKNINKAIASDLTWLECRRTIDRNRINNLLGDSVTATLHSELDQFFKNVSRVNISDQIINEASKPFSTKLGTLDAIHLFTALSFIKKYKEPLTFVTHDKELHNACIMSSILCIGVIA